MSYWASVCRNEHQYAVMIVFILNWLWLRCIEHHYVVFSMIMSYTECDYISMNMVMFYWASLSSREYDYIVLGMIMLYQATLSYWVWLGRNYYCIYGVWCIENYYVILSIITSWWLWSCSTEYDYVALSTMTLLQVWLCRTQCHYAVLVWSTQFANLVHNSTTHKGPQTTDWLTLTYNISSSSGPFL